MLTGWLIAVVALGSVRHGRVAYAEEEARLRATEERLRIARELHDVLGHHVSLINVQAGAALHRLKKDPAQAGEALGAIKASSRETLRELRAHPRRAPSGRRGGAAHGTGAGAGPGG